MSSNHAKRYSREFKQEAVRLLMTSGKTATQLGRDLGVSKMSLGTWREQAIGNGDPSQAAIKLLAKLVQREALVLTYNDLLLLIGALFVFGLMLLPLVRRQRSLMH